MVSRPEYALTPTLLPPFTIDVRFYMELHSLAIFQIPEWPVCTPQRTSFLCEHMLHGVSNLALRPCARVLARTLNPG